MIELRKWYIKWWWVIGIVLFLLSLRDIIIQLLPPEIGKIVKFLYPFSVWEIILFPWAFFAWTFRGLDIAGPGGLPIVLIFYLLPCYFIAKILSVREKKISVSIRDWYLKRWWVVAFIWLFVTPILLKITSTPRVPSYLWKILAFPFFIVVKDKGIHIELESTIPIIIASYFISCYILAKILELGRRKGRSQ